MSWCLDHTSSVSDSIEPSSRLTAQSWVSISGEKSNLGPSRVRAVSIHDRVTSGG